jgi:uncharacterized protein
MSTSTAQNLKSQLSKVTPWWEIAIIIALFFAVHFFAPGLNLVFSFMLVGYMIVESLLRHRTWAENGFGIRDIPAGLLNNLGWVLLVAFGTQALFIFSEYFFLPDVFTHIVARVPLNIATLSVGLFISLAVATFLEELIFRALFQNRLSTFVSPAIAIGLISLVFAIGHFSTGPVMIVVVDLLAVFVDSLIYGLIFQRSKNVFVAWIPHYLADIFAIVLLIVLR